MGLTIQTQDQTHAEIDVTGLTIDDSGNVTVNYQKVLVDDTDGSREPDGTAQTLTLQPADAQTLLTAIEPVLTPILSSAPAATGTGPDCRRHYCASVVIRNALESSPNPLPRRGLHANLIACLPSPWERGDVRRGGQRGEDFLIPNKTIMIRLFINWYNDKDADRRRELETALRINLHLPVIDEVINLSDIKTPAWATGKVKNMFIKGRPTFHDFFGAVNHVAAPADISVICNLDIYHGATLAYAAKLQANQCYALSRYNMVNAKPVFFNRADSQDTWIFRGRIKPMPQANFTLGVCACDNSLAHILTQNGYRVLNPSKTIITHHLHQSEARSYLNERGERIGPTIPGPYVYLEPVSLK